MLHIFKWNMMQYRLNNIFFIRKWCTLNVLPLFAILDMGKASSVTFFVPLKTIYCIEWLASSYSTKRSNAQWKDYLCDKHFMPQDIIRFESVVVNGEVNNLPQKPILKESAIPCIWHSKFNLPNFNLLFYELH